MPITVPYSGRLWPSSSAFTPTGQRRIMQTRTRKQNERDARKLVLCARVGCRRARIRVGDGDIFKREVLLSRLVVSLEKGYPSPASEHSMLYIQSFFPSSMYVLPTRRLALERTRLHSRNGVCLLSWNVFVMKLEPMRSVGVVELTRYSTCGWQRTSRAAGRTLSNAVHGGGGQTDQYRSMLSDPFVCSQPHTPTWPRAYLQWPTGVTDPRISDQLLTDRHISWFFLQVI